MTDEIIPGGNDVFPAGKHICRTMVKVTVHDIAPIITGIAACPCCGAAWNAQAPEGVRRLECPHCHLMTGGMLGHTGIELCAECGHWAFVLLRSEVRCARCDAVAVSVAG